jgi:hypothetical protein
MNSKLGGVQPSWVRLCARVDRPYPPLPLSHDWCIVRSLPLSHLVVMITYLNWVLSLVSLVPRIAVIWTCDQLDWFSPIIIIFIDTNFPFTRTPREREEVDSCLGCHFVYFPDRFLGCLELFSNSPLSVLREWRPWVDVPLTRTLPPDYHENHLISVDWSLIVFFELV